MSAKQLIEKLRRNEPAIGSWVMLRDPAAVEILVEAGFDWLCIDAEHAPYSPESLQHSLIALRGSETAGIVRVADNAESYIKIALDLGADGVMVPMICSAADVEQAVAAAKYPPLGRRGYGPLRASGYLRRIEQYLGSANEGTLLIGQIEHIDAVRNIGQILDAKGLDAVYVGPGDLSQSMGYQGQLNHPEVIEAAEQVFAAAREASVPCGTLTSTTEELAFWQQRGGTLMTIGGDLWFLRDGVDAAIAAARRTVNIKA